MYILSPEEFYVLSYACPLRYILFGLVYAACNGIYCVFTKIILIHISFYFCICSSYFICFDRYAKVSSTSKYYILLYSYRCMESLFVSVYVYGTFETGTVAPHTSTI